MKIAQEEGEAVSGEGSQEEDAEEVSDDAGSPEGEDPIPVEEELPLDSEQSEAEPDEEEESTGGEEETRAARKARKSAKPKVNLPQAPKDIKTTVSSELTRERARQDRRYHSKKSVGKAGRTKGSKMKSDTRVKISAGDGWD